MEEFIRAVRGSVDRASFAGQLQAGVVNVMRAMYCIAGQELVTTMGTLDLVAWVLI